MLYFWNSSPVFFSILFHNNHKTLNQRILRNNPGIFIFLTSTSPRTSTATATIHDNRFVIATKGIWKGDDSTPITLIHNTHELHRRTDAERVRSDLNPFRALSRQPPRIYCCFVDCWSATDWLAGWLADWSSWSDIQC